MGWFSKLDVGKVFTTVSSGVDKAFFTKEEKADFNMKLADAGAQFTKDTLSENTVRSVTRRYVAIAIIFMYLFLVLAYVSLVLFTMKDVSVFKALLFDSPLSTGFIMVLAFFFGGYYLKNFKGLTVNKKNKE